MSEPLDIEGDIGGWCPVQGEGKVDGHVWYFRARGQHWALHIAAVGIDDAVGAGEDSPGWCIWEQWGDREYDAGYMPEDVVWSMIAKAVDLWRSGKAEYFSGKAPESIDVTDADVDAMVAQLRKLAPDIAPPDREELRARMTEGRKEQAERLREVWGDGVPEEQAWSEVARLRVKKPNATS